MQKQTKEKNELTYGQKLVGLRFNPSGATDVDAIKSGFANVIDAMKEIEIETVSNRRIQLLKAAEMKALEAQMLAVKAITWKD